MKKSKKAKASKTKTQQYTCTEENPFESFESMFKEVLAGFQPEPSTFQHIALVKFFNNVNMGWITSEEAARIQNGTIK